MRPLLIILTLLLTGTSFCFSQEKSHSIKGSILDATAKPLESATVSLLKSADSSLIKSTVSDKTGAFSFENTTSGNYLLSFSAVGHVLSYSKAIEVNDINNQITLKPVTLNPISKTLNAVVVNNTKPFIEQKAGKTVINVEASPTNIGLNVLDLLQKSPGVTVDNDGNISLKGKQGVTILIDGKPTYMSGADLAAFLKNMQSTSLSQIEIMSNPPAKYDAAGNSGIINIKTKKGTIKGMNGSA